MAGCFVLTACAAGPDHERLGDRRYGEHDWVDALAEYRLAMQQHRPGAELRAKYAQAALRAGALGEAVSGYEGLALAESASTQEAAEGLARAAQLAAGSRDMSALTDAIVALHQVAPRWPVGALAVTLGASSTTLTSRPDVMDVLLEAAAAAPQRSSADSFLVAWADVNARLGRCDQARLGYDGVLRRKPLPGLARQSEAGLARCALQDGRLSLSAGALQDAEASFRDAIAIGEPDSIVRLAWLLLGDTRWAGGDTANALDAYRHAIAGAGEGDPTATRATAQMERLLGPRDSTP
jgi:tetratricopeptide (TPR) repeat protein